MEVTILGEGPRMPERKRQWAYELSKCMTCGVCMEACPNVSEKLHSSDQLHYHKYVYSIHTQQVQ